MKLHAENLREGQKIQYKRDHNLETLGSIHKKNATLPEAYKQWKAQIC